MEAFDTVQHHWLLIGMAHVGAPPEFLDYVTKILKGHTRSVQTAYTNSTPHTDCISPQSGTFQGDPQASTLFLFCQHLTLMLVEKYGGPGFPLPPTPLPPGCEGPLTQPLQVQVLSYADDTKPIDTTLKGVLQSMSMATLGQSIQGIRNNGSKALLTIPPGDETPSPPPSILAAHSDLNFLLSYPPQKAFASLDTDSNNPLLLTP